MRSSRLTKGDGCETAPSRGTFYDRFDERRSSRIRAQPEIDTRRPLDEVADDLEAIARRATLEP